MPVNKTYKNSCLHGAYFLVGRMYLKHVRQFLTIMLTKELVAESLSFFYTVLPHSASRCPPLRIFFLYNLPPIDCPKPFRFLLELDKAQRYRLSFVKGSLS